MSPPAAASGEKASDGAGPGGVRTAKIAAAAGVCVALVALAAYLFPRGDDDAPNSDAGGDRSCSVTGDGNVCIGGEVTELLDDEELSDGEVKEQLGSAGAPPSDTGPWPFVVLDTEELGLKVRDDPGREGKQIGASVNRSTMWVDCRTENDFDADPATGAGPLWYRVRWPTSSPSEQYLSSQPNDPSQGWAYAGYLFASGPMPELPDC